ncbi:von Willebrand factor A domain-containing protein 5A-like [Salvelinus sp. IW2-2015]|uniref:von Willebrand factor A domain-containing protein 5A-like n=1 Tax=Salvelinus sp. IW2-2015 TaxID=2691554 RepID=UPI0038D46B99
MTVHRLGARTLIQSLEVEEREQDGEKEGVKEKVIELSVQSGVSSAFTAFIAVHKGDGEALHGQLLRRQVPTPMLYHSPMPMGDGVVVWLSKRHAHR